MNSCCVETCWEEGRKEEGRVGGRSARHRQINGRSEQKRIRRDRLVGWRSREGSPTGSQGPIYMFLSSATTTRPPPTDTAHSSSAPLPCTPHRRPAPNEDPCSASMLRNHESGKTADRYFIWSGQCCARFSSTRQHGRPPN